MDRTSVRLGVIGAVVAIAAFAAHRFTTGTPVAPVAATAPVASSGAPRPLGWSRRFGEGRDGGARLVGVAVDRDGDVIATGALYGTVDFGGGPLVSEGEDDVFVVKLDPSGKHLWSKRFGGPGYQDPAALAVDERGIVIVGTLDRTADFGGGPLTSAGLVDVFVVKLDPSGKHLWSRRFGDGEEQEASGVALDADGAVVLAGSFEGAMDFGGGPLVSAGEDDVYVAKLDASGKHVWSRRFGDERAQKGRAVAVDSAGGIVVAGALHGAADFGGGPLRSEDADALFVAKLDAAGKHLWSRRFAGGTGSRANPRGLAIDPSGAIAVAGTFHGTLDLGESLASAGDDDAFVAKLDAAGKPLWSRKLGGAEPAGVAALAGGAFVVAGRFEDAMGSAGGSLVSAGKDDAFVTTFDAAGAVVESRRFGDADRQAASGVAGVRGGGVVVGGTFQGVIDLGDGPLTGPGVFLAKLAR